MENKEVQKIKEYLKVLSEVDNTPVDKEEVKLDSKIEAAKVLANEFYNYQPIMIDTQSIPVTFDENQLARIREAFALSQIQERNIITGARGMDLLNAYNNANLRGNE